ncbi:MAG: hypothetical protein HY822_02270 [Acidobacteria bacterium]|nr:hypothetical protein [Acidobacteriota bacterium]
MPTPMPVDMPLRPGEASALAEVVFRHLGGRPPTDDVRARLGSRLAALELGSIRPYIGSLVEDPTHQATYYLAADSLAGPAPAPLLLHLASSSAPFSALFPKAMLVARMQPVGGREVVVNAIPFGPRDTANLRAYAEKLDRAFLPRPQGALPSIAAASARPETGFPAAFEAFRQIRQAGGANWAAVAGDAGAGLWAAIRAGWREGYTALAGRLAVPADGNLAGFAETVREQDLCSRFIVDPSAALDAGTDAELEGRFDRALPLCAEIFDLIRRIRRSFDFELALDRSPAPTTPEELAFCLGWLKSHGRAARLVAPNPGQGERLAELAAVARQFNATLSFHSARDWERVGAAAAGRVSVTVRLDEEPPPDLVKLTALLRG